MKSIKKQIRNVGLFLLLLSFFTSLISDLIYNTVEFAKEHAVGVFLNGLATFSFTLLTIVILLGCFYEFCLRKVLGTMIDQTYYKDLYEEETKPIKRNTNQK